MGQLVIRCRVAVPGAVYVRGTSLDDPVRPPSVRLSFWTGETCNGDEDLYYLSLTEAEDVASWLVAAAQALDAGGSDRPDLAVTRETCVSVDEFARGRLALYGSKLAPADDCDEVGIIVDVAGPSDGLSRRVRLAFIDDVVVYSLSATRAREIASALAAAVAHLRNDPPVVARDLIVGSFQIAVSDWGSRIVEVDVQGMVNEPEWPRVAIRIAADEDGSANCGDSWYLLDDEVMRLSEFLNAATIATEQEQAPPIGELRNDGPASGPQPWLAVTVEVPPFADSSEAPWVLIRFDDPLVRESGSDGCIWLRPESARAASRLLMAAIEEANVHPPLVFWAPAELAIADLRWNQWGGTK